MQASNEEFMHNNEDHILLGPESKLKLNIKLDIACGNKPENILNGCMDDRSYLESSKGRFENERNGSMLYDYESRNDDREECKESLESINTVITIETALHSWNSSESKNDDDIIQSPHQKELQNMEETTENSVKSDDNSNSKIGLTIQTESTTLKRKSCLSVRTLKESLSISIKSNKNVKKEVSFGKLQIREYEIQLVNNPACGGGPPIGIGWEYDEKEDMDLKDVIDVEKKYIKTSNKSSEPCNNLLMIKPFDRLAMLKRNGYTDQEILECMLDVKACQKQRIKSTTASSKDEERKEIVNRVTKKIKKLCRSKEEKKRDQIIKSFCCINNGKFKEDK